MPSSSNSHEATLGRVQLPRFWLVVQVLIVIFVAVGMIIAATKLY
jgi:hypothetical protein